MTKMLNFSLKIKGGGVVGRVAHAKSSDPATPLNLERVLAHITGRNEKTEVITSSCLVKIIGTHLEIIKDGGIAFSQFSRLLLILTRLPF